MSEMTRPSEQKSDAQGQTIIINQQKNQSNGAGIAGFILALISLFIGWVPILGWLFWFLGLVLSFIGIFRKPRGLAIAGLIISLLGLILLLFIFAGLALLGGAASMN
jgi:hypothetical protein